MSEGVERRVRLTIELPVEDYVKTVLLVVKGEYHNIKHVIWEGLKRVFKDYDEEFFEKLKEENRDIVENILKNVKIVERSRLRKWVVKRRGGQR